MNIGDTFIGWTLVEAKETEFNEIEASFSGEASLKGTLLRQDFSEGPSGWIEFIEIIEVFKK